MHNNPHPRSYVRPVAHHVMAVLVAFYTARDTARLFGASEIFAYLGAFVAACATAAYCQVELHEAEGKRLERYARRSGRHVRRGRGRQPRRRR